MQKYDRLTLLTRRKAVRRLEEISAVSEYGVTRGEAARRARMLEAVQTKERRLEEMERGSRGDRQVEERFRCNMYLLNRRLR